MRGREGEMDDLNRLSTCFRRINTSFGLHWVKPTGRNHPVFSLDESCCCYCCYYYHHSCNPMEEKMKEKAEVVSLVVLMW